MQALNQKNFTIIGGNYITTDLLYSFLCLADVCSPTPGKNPAEPVDTIIVPTVVGCVLAGLIVILIITYFVGRCKRTGYEKM